MTFVRSFYNGCLEYLQTPNEYLFYDVFPDAPLVQTNADTKIINLRSKSRFPTSCAGRLTHGRLACRRQPMSFSLDDCVGGSRRSEKAATPPPPPVCYTPPSNAWMISGEVILPGDIFRSCH